MKGAWIIVAYNTPPESLETLRRQIAILNPEGKVWVVDNSHTGKGYAAGINQGITLAEKESPDFFVALNPDISFIGPLKPYDFAEVMGHFDLWGWTMRQAGKTYYGGGYDRWRLSTMFHTVRPEERLSAVSFVTGSCLFFSRKTYEEVGAWDEGYGMYYEDADYCMRAYKKGLRLGIDRDRAYEHAEASDRSNLQKRTCLRNNRWRFFWRYASPLQKVRECIRLPFTRLEELL